MDDSLKKKIKAAFWAGDLKVTSCDSDGNIRQSVVSNVTRHEIPEKKAYEVRFLVDGNEESVTCSEDHSLFRFHNGKPVEVETGNLVVGDTLFAVRDNFGIPVEITAIHEVPMPEFMYDLTVPGDENFVLANGIVAHNSYSIGGISLDIDKASGYESLKGNAEGQLDKATEAKKMTTLYVSGLRQPKYGVGVRSAFGPNVGRGVLGPRSFVG
jgi:hypothetical protein